MQGERILFVTGKLAEPALRRVIASLSESIGFSCEIRVLSISVAALMHAEWIARKLPSVDGFDRILLPGLAQGDIEKLSQQYGVIVQRGPKDLRDLPMFFGRQQRKSVDLSRHDIEIIAEINHAPRLKNPDILSAARLLSADGADVIDLGCIPGESWPHVGEVTRMLRDEGLRISIDSFDRDEVERSVEAGAELVLSCNQTNLEWAKDLGVELVAIPDTPDDLSSLNETVVALHEAGVSFRIDPILEPIGFGFARSLERYLQCRNKWPDADMMMGVGNLTELTEVDSAGINLLLAGFCQEQGIRSVLTTQVINWTRTAVKEFDLARRLVFHAVQEKTLPKHLDSQLVMLRDPRVEDRTPEELRQLAEQITDPNFRIFVEQGQIHIMNRDGFWSGNDPFELFDCLCSESAIPESSHAFYLGYELAKAITALTLGKRYTQDEALQWGFLTTPEISAHERRRQKRQHAANHSPDSVSQKSGV